MIKKTSRHGTQGIISSPGIVLTNSESIMNETVTDHSRLHSINYLIKFDPKSNEVFPMIVNLSTFFLRFGRKYCQIWQENLVNGIDKQ